MIYELRTYNVKPGSVPEFEAILEEALPYREKYSKLAGWWHTEVGPLNQVVHIWPYEDLNERARVRAEAAKDANWPPQNGHLMVNMESEIMVPAPFMRPLGSQQLGNLYEMRIYTYQVNTIPEVIRRWSEAIPYREKFSPLAACFYSEIGKLNRWIHLWPYKDMGERNRIRAEAAKDPHWPPGTMDLLISMENKFLVPASFSPLR